MPEVLLGQDRALIDARTDQLHLAAGSYDLATTPGLGHLRPHQIGILAAGLAYTERITADELVSPHGACILAPPGAGKTISGAGLITALRTPNFSPKTLYLTHRTAIQHDAENRFATFAPDSDTFVYAGNTKKSGDVCLMSYQAMLGAVKSGFIDKFNPDLVIADEVHHVIDGEWARIYEEVAKGRLSIGMTATPAYNHIKTVRRLFPHVLSHTTFKEGVAEGYVSSFNSNMYKSSVRHNGDFEGMARDMLDALSIAQRYAELGKIGIIACIPGDDTAHARSVAELAKKFGVDKTNTSLKILSVNGAMGPKVVRRHIEQLRQGEIDGLAYTQILGEGVDLPELDYMVILGWTMSVVLAAQRLGRTTRLGKKSDIHEFHRSGYVSHMDAFSEGFDTIPEGEDYTEKSPRVLHETKQEEQHRRADYIALVRLSTQILSSGENTVRMPDQMVSIGDGVERPSYEWLTQGQLMAKTLLDAHQLDAILSDNGIVSTKVALGGFEREYFSPDALTAVVKELEPTEMPTDTHMRLDDAFRGFRVSRTKDRSLSRFKRGLAEQNLKPELFVDDDGNPFLGVPIESMTIARSASATSLRGLSNLAQRRKQHTQQLPEQQLEVVSVEQPIKPALQLQIEKFLDYLASGHVLSGSHHHEQQRRLAKFRHALKESETLPDKLIGILEARANTLEPSSVAARNLVTIGEKNRLSPAQVLGAMMYVLNNT